MPFLAEWYDGQADLMRRYQLLYFITDSTVEMIDVKSRRVFLKRCKCDTLKPEQLFVGSTVNVLARQLKILEYGDEHTKKCLDNRQERTLLIVKPKNGMEHLSDIIDSIRIEDFLICNLRSVRVSREDAREFYAPLRGRPEGDAFASVLSSGPCVAIELMGDGAINKIKALAGPEDPRDARSQAPQSLRSQFGKDLAWNAVHVSDSSVHAAREIDFFFGTASGSRSYRPNLQSTARFSDSTLCVIRPHAIGSGLAGKIIGAVVSGGFEISAIELFRLETANAEEFLEIYKGVVPEYSAMVQELTCGACIALEVRLDGSREVAHKFRQLVGPSDPEIARHLRPKSIRARFGRDKINNAVHCTDLPEDAPLEVEYFFRILQS
eukprot:Opistho-2@66115